jgi:hypothetical protein
VYDPRFELYGFEVLPELARCRIVLELVRAMVLINQIEIRQLRPPPLYKAGVVYAFQGLQDDWKDLTQVLATGCGSCNSLAAWRCAELLEQGVEAGPYIRTDAQQERDGGLTEVFHVIVRIGPRGSSQFEDPSELLGMPTSATG